MPRSHHVSRVSTKFFFTRRGVLAIWLHCLANLIDLEIGKYTPFLIIERISLLEVRDFQYERFFFKDE